LRLDDPFDIAVDPTIHKASSALSRNQAVYVVDLVSQVISDSIAVPERLQE
jgi:hypothetical protein